MTPEVWRERLAAAIEENEIALARVIAEHIPEAEYHEESAEGHALFWALTGRHEIGSNAVLRCQVSEEATGALIARIQARFRARGVSCLWWAYPWTRPTTIGDALLAAGFIYRGEGPGMGRALEALPALDTVPGLEIVRVRNAAEMGEWLRVSYLNDPEQPAVLASEVELASRVLLASDFHGGLFLGRFDGRPAATSMYFGRHEATGNAHGATSKGDLIATISWVATVPALRRRGIGAALTLAAMRAARKDGYRATVLMASPLGQPVYRRLGFEEVCRLRSYRWTPAG